MPRAWGSEGGKAALSGNQAKHAGFSERSGAKGEGWDWSHRPTFCPSERGLPLCSDVLTFTVTQSDKELLPLSGLAPHSRETLTSL